jgi:ParB-like chromosome segregation protein Spo0J
VASSSHFAIRLEVDLPFQGVPWDAVAYRCLPDGKLSMTEPPTTNPRGDWYQLGLFMRELRDAHGLTQAQLAALAGLDRRSISNYEKGNIPASAPRIPQGYFSVADALGMSREEVLLLLEGASASPRDYERIMDAVAAIHRSANISHDKKMIAGVHYRLLAQRMTQAKGKSGSEQAPTRPKDMPVRTIGASSSEKALSLFPTVSLFALECVRAGADSSLRDAFEELAQALLAQARDQSKIQQRLADGIELSWRAGDTDAYAPRSGDWRADLQEKLSNDDG